eukprot:6157564-Pleurochrysis_carterae.AAC.2
MLRELLRNPALTLQNTCSAESKTCEWWSVNNRSDPSTGTEGAAFVTCPSDDEFAPELRFRRGSWVA